MTTDYEKVLEWFGWKREEINTKVFGDFNTPARWWTPDDEYIAYHAENALAQPDYQARYFDPYILEKGCSFETKVVPYRDGSCRVSHHIYIYDEPGKDWYGTAKGDPKTAVALAKREAYIKLCEVENEGL